MINHQINSLNGGVSEQAPELRYENQVDEMNNCFIIPSQGLRRRNPIETFVNDARLPNNSFLYSYGRGDGIEEYIINISKAGLSIYDRDGRSYPVNYTLYDGKTVLELWGDINYSIKIKCLTVGDTTFILNMEQTVAMSKKNSKQYPNNYGFIWIKQNLESQINGSSGYRYSNGHYYECTYSGRTVTFGRNPYAPTPTVAEHFRASFGGKRVGSVVRLTGTGTLVMKDGYGDTVTEGWQKNIKRLTDLPSTLKGFTEDEVGIIEVTGKSGDDFTNYYLGWTGEKYKEVMKEGIEYEIDKTTFLAKLVRNADNSFTLSFIEDLADRTVGDNDSNPLPSFIGRKISNMFFFRNRLALASDESVCFSEVGNAVNFFATTVMEVKDNDPIDIDVDSSTVAFINHCSVVGGSITLWTQNQQFICAGADAFTPKTARIKQVSSYDCSTIIPPVNADNQVIFFSEKGEKLEVYDYATSVGEADTSTANSISLQLKKYLPSNINKAVINDKHNILLLTNNSNIVYGYKYHIQNNTKSISSWFTFTLPVEVVQLTSLEDDIYIQDIDGNLSVLNLYPKELDSTFLDFGTMKYESKVIMTPYNIITRSDSSVIREPFFMKTLFTNSDGDYDFIVKNGKRDIITNSKYAKGRKLVVGGNSENTKVGFISSYENGFEIGTINIDGIPKRQSQNI